MSAPKPIKVWGIAGPNPPKVHMVLEELGVPRELEPIKISETKNEEYVKINPNGRIPAIHDPNTGMTLWESGAIIEYLIEKYDTEHKISFKPGTPEYYQAKQFLFYQVSGQGPYYGQAVWFNKYHPEQVQSAKDRYANEVKRVSGVLEAILAKEEKKYGGKGDGPWLVGNKLSYADLSFFMWQTMMANMMADLVGYKTEDYPRVTAWIGKMSARPAVSKVMGEVMAAMANH